MNIPSDYIEGYAKARAVAPDLADNYVAHTMIADPKADAVMEEMRDIDRREAARFVNIAMDNIEDPRLRDAPTSLVEFFKDMEPHRTGWTSTNSCRGFGLSTGIPSWCLRRLY